MHLFKWLSVSVYLYLACAGVASASTEKNHALSATAQPSAQHHWPTPKAIPSNANALIQIASPGDLSDASDNHWLTPSNILPNFGFARQTVFTVDYFVAPSNTITYANQSRAPPAINC